MYNINREINTDKGDKKVKPIDVLVVGNGYNLTLYWENI